MFTTPAAGRRIRRLTASRWFAVSVLGFTLTGVAAAQNYGQPSYPQQSYGYPAETTAQQGYNNQGYAQDPPSRVARLSTLQGTVSLQPATVPDFSPAEINYPLTTGDRLWADAGSLAELQFGQAAVRLGQQTDLTVTTLTDAVAQFGLAQGSVHLRTFAFDPGTTTEVDTPNASVGILQPGDVRVDVYPQSDTQAAVTVVTLLSGAAQVNGDGVSQQLSPGESLEITGSAPSYAQDVRRNRADGLDNFSSNQDNIWLAAVSADSNYVSDDTIGVADLATYGDWSGDADYGSVWFPRAVPADWQPYRFGHWAYVAPWGWTWVESEPWGFAPFHYGRWGQFHGRWGWIPGPPVVHPIYSPALVAFVGGGNAGVTAWFPLGPRETYQPWYHVSDRYITRVNVTNIYNRNTVDVRNVYVNAGRVPSPFRFDANAQFVNRPVATVAVRQDVFAGGRSVRGADFRPSPGQFDRAPVLAHPTAAPTRAIMAPSGGSPARALPPQGNRPVMSSRPPFAAQGEGFRNGGQSTPGSNGAPLNGYGNGGRPFNNGQPPSAGNGGSSPYGGRPGNGYPGTGYTAPGATAQPPAQGQPGYPGRFNNGRNAYGNQPVGTVPPTQSSRPQQGQTPGNTGVQAQPAPVQGGAPRGGFYPGDSGNGQASRYPVPTTQAPATGQQPSRPGPTSGYPVYPSQTTAPVQNRPGNQTPAQQPNPGQPSPFDGHGRGRNLPGTGEAGGQQPGRFQPPSYPNQQPSAPAQSRPAATPSQSQPGQFYGRPVLGPRDTVPAAQPQPTRPAPTPSQPAPQPSRPQPTAPPAQGSQPRQQGNPPARSNSPQTR